MDEIKYVEILDSKDILLRPSTLRNGNMPNGQPATHVTLSRMGPVFLWFSKLMAGEEVSDELPAVGKTYHAHINANGDVFIKEIRDGHSNEVGYTSTEIPCVLEQFQSAMAIVNA
ncbi:MAG: hypothetical protein LBK73_15635 [Treponema sp.]|jgi:hypothetical protein|nr:hypothetical protein [Treponema sp.]